MAVAGAAMARFALAVLLLPLPPTGEDVPDSAIILERDTTCRPPLPFRDSFA